MEKEINYQQQLIQGIEFIHEWINNNQQTIDQESEDFKELVRVIEEILQDQDFSKNAFEDIRFVLTPFEEQLPLKIKRKFNVSKMDQYTMFIASRWFETIDDYINLIMTTRRFNQILTKFHYNPIALTSKTREFFDHLQTLYIYSSYEDLFKNDNRIIARNILKNDVYNLYFYQMKYLEEWTGLKCGKILFDSKNLFTSEFNDKIYGKQHLTFLIEDSKEIFGYYLDTEIVKGSTRNMRTNCKSFHFNIQSKNNRLKTPMRFEIKDTYCGYKLYGKLDRGVPLIIIGNVWLQKENKRNESFCYQNEDSFDYHGIPQALCGKEPDKFGKMYFTPKRIRVIQMN